MPDEIGFGYASGIAAHRAIEMLDTERESEAARADHLQDLYMEMVKEKPAVNWTAFIVGVVGGIPLGWYVTRWFRRD